MRVLLRRTVQHSRFPHRRDLNARQFPHIRRHSRLTNSSNHQSPIPAKPPLQPQHDRIIRIDEPFPRSLAPRRLESWRRETTAEAFILCADGPGGVDGADGPNGAWASGEPDGRTDEALHRTMTACNASQCRQLWIDSIFISDHYNSFLVIDRA